MPSSFCVDFFACERFLSFNEYLCSRTSKTARPPVRFVQNVRFEQFDIRNLLNDQLRDFIPAFDFLHHCFGQPACFQRILKRLLFVFRTFYFFQRCQIIENLIIGRILADDSDAAPIGCIHRPIMNA